jgi:SET domain-containing protein
MPQAPLPHHGVYARLAPSPIHGVGVFAIWDIPAGATVFEKQVGPRTPVARETVDQLQAPYRHLYQDYCVLEDQTYFGPASFNTLTMAWYLNHSDEANLEYSHGSRFIARRAIRMGEELTADYRTYSPNPFPWTRR